MSLLQALQNRLLNLKTVDAAGTPVRFEPLKDELVTPPANRPSWVVSYAGRNRVGSEDQCDILILLRPAWSVAAETVIEAATKTVWRMLWQMPGVEFDDATRVDTVDNNIATAQVTIRVTDEGQATGWDDPQ